jgi:hypothetical protein
MFKEFVSDCNWRICAAADGTVKLWGAYDGKFSQTFEGHSMVCHSLDVLQARQEVNYYGSD